MKTYTTQNPFALSVLALLAIIALTFAPTLAFADEDDDDETEVTITGSALDAASEAALDYIGEGRVTDTEVGDEDGYYEVEVTRDDGSEVDVHLDQNFNVLGTEDEDEDDDEDEREDEGPDTPIPSNVLAPATAAALAHVGGGHVTDTEYGDEEGIYEVEVTRTDGSVVDVHLDEHFNVLSTEEDTDDEDDDDEIDGETVAELQQRLIAALKQLITLLQGR